MNPLIQAYTNTAFKVFEPSTIIKIGKKNDSLNQQVLCYDANECSLIISLPRKIS